MKTRLSPRTFAFFLACFTNATRAAPIGEFEQAVDVGKIALPGSSEFLAGKGQYRLTGSSLNMWAKEDAFQFLHKKLLGDLSFTMDVAWEGAAIPATGLVASWGAVTRTITGKVTNNSGVGMSGVFMTRTSGSNVVSAQI